MSGKESDQLRRCFASSYRLLVGQLYTVCGDLTEAEDVVSEAFVRAAALGGRFADVENPEAWLRTVALNAARTRYRRRAMGSLLHRRAVEVRHAGLADEAHLDLIAALRQLPQAQREAVALHYLADLSVEDVAVAVGSPPGTVKARLSRGRKALAALLEPQTQEAPHV